MAILRIADVEIELSATKLDDEHPAFPHWPAEEESPILTTYLFEGEVSFGRWSKVRYEFRAPLVVQVGRVQETAEDRVARVRRTAAGRIPLPRRTLVQRSQARERELIKQHSVFTHEPTMNRHMAVFLVQCIMRGDSPLEATGPDLLEDCSVLSEYQPGHLIVSGEVGGSLHEFKTPIDITRWLIDHGDPKPEPNWEDTVWNRHAIDDFDGHLNFANREAATAFITSLKRYGDIIGSPEAEASYGPNLPDDDRPFPTYGMAFFRKWDTRRQQCFVEQRFRSDTYTPDVDRTHQLQVSGYAKHREVRMWPDITPLMSLVDFRGGRR